MTLVRRDRVDRTLVRIESDGEALLVFEPEVFVEAALQFGGALAPRSRLVTPAELVEEVRPREVGGVCVALHLGQRDRRLGQGAVGELDAIPRVLPPLVGQAVISLALVFDVAVAVEVAVFDEPVDRRFGVGGERVDDLGGEAPAPKFAEHDDEQRRGVGGAVVDRAAAERQGRRLAEAHLVQDASRFFLGAGVDLGALETRQRLQHAEGEVGFDHHRHPRREQRVATEQRHEPRRTGSDDGALGVLGVEHAQRAEVFGAAGDDRRQQRVIGVDLGDRGAPAVESFLGRRHGDGHAGLEARFDRLAVDGDRGADRGLPGSVRPGRSPPT